MQSINREAKRIAKDIDNNLKITIEANKKIVNFLDVTLDLNNGEYMPYTKPNNTLQYVHAKSNHPPVVLRNLPAGVNKRLSEISSNEDMFNKATPMYQKALDQSGHIFKLKYQRSYPAIPRKRNRKRNIIWFNPPYDQGIKTNIGREFLKIINRCFPPTHKLHKILNKNTIKLSYSCMPNMKSIIDNDNKRKLRAAQEQQAVRKCNCPKNAVCPLEGECLAKEIIYQATVKSEGKEETCVGLTATDFKSRLANHKASFKMKSKSNTTELSKYVWQLKEKNLDYSIKWKILSRAPQYNNKTKKCNLCIAEKLFIICKPNSASLNKRNELHSFFLKEPFSVIRT